MADEINVNLYEDTILVNIEEVCNTYTLNDGESDIFATLEETTIEVILNEDNINVTFDGAKDLKPYAKKSYSVAMSIALG